MEDVLVEIGKNELELRMNPLMMEVVLYGKGLLLFKVFYL